MGWGEHVRGGVRRFSGCGGAGGWIGVGANMFAEGCVDGDVLATVNISAAGEDKLFSGKHQHNKGVTHARFHFP
mgnify:CR=1 FL=1